MQNKKHGAMVCDKSLEQFFDKTNDVIETSIKQKSVFSENEFNESDTDIEELLNDSDVEMNKFELSNVDDNKSKIVHDNIDVVKSFFNEISSAAIWLRIKNYDCNSGSSLMQSYFINHLHNYINLSHSVYWADKLLLKLTENTLLRSNINKALLPYEDIFNNCDSEDDLTKRLSQITMSHSRHNEETQHILPMLHSYKAHNEVTDQHGVFINAGSFIKKKCWLPVNPDLQKDQFLAVVIYSDQIEGSEDFSDKNRQMIQLYRFRNLTMGTSAMSVPELEMVLTHNWGRTTDICWSPQPLPVVVRSVPLIGHLAVACEDGYVRIIPILEREIKSQMVKMAANSRVLCLGRAVSRGVYPTCMDWCQQYPSRIVVGYSSGEVGLYVLEAGLSTDTATIVNDSDICIRPRKYMEVFDKSIKSIQTSPNNNSQIAVTSYLEAQTLIVDLSATQGLPSRIVHKAPVMGPSVLWTEPGDLVTIVGGHSTICSTGLIFCAAHQPPKTVLKVSLPSISAASFSPALNVIPVGTRDGQLRITSLNATDMKKVLYAKTNDSKHRSESAVRSKFYHQYEVVPIIDGGKTPVLQCQCPRDMACVHELLSKYAVVVSQTETVKADNWRLQSMIAISGVAINPNPGACTWIAVSLKCGLIHIVPLTHFYNASLDELINGTRNATLEAKAQSLHDPSLLPQKLSCSNKSGRPRKYPVGINYQEFYKKIGKITTKKTRIRTRSISKSEIELENNIVNTTIQPSVTVEDKSVRRRSTKITDFFANTDTESQAIVDKRKLKKTGVKPRRISKKMLSKEKSILSVSTINEKDDDEIPLRGKKLIKSTKKDRKIKSLHILNSSNETCSTNQSSNKSDWKPFPRKKKISVSEERPRVTRSSLALLDDDIITDVSEKSPQKLNIEPSESDEIVLRLTKNYKKKDCCQNNNLAPQISSIVPVSRRVTRLSMSQSTEDADSTPQKPGNSTPKKCALIVNCSPRKSMLTESPYKQILIKSPEAAPTRNSPKKPTIMKNTERFDVPMMIDDVNSLNETAAEIIEVDVAQKKSNTLKKAANTLKKSAVPTKRTKKSLLLSQSTVEMAVITPTKSNVKRTISVEDKENPPKKPRKYVRKSKIIAEDKSDVDTENQSKLNEIKTPVKKSKKSLNLSKNKNLENLDINPVGELLKKSITPSNDEVTCSPAKESSVIISPKKFNSPVNQGKHGKINLKRSSTVSVVKEHSSPKKSKTVHVSFAKILEENSTKERLEKDESQPIQIDFNNNSISSAVVATVSGEHNNLLSKKWRPSRRFNTDIDSEMEPIHDTTQDKQKNHIIIKIAEVTKDKNIPSELPQKPPKESQEDSNKHSKSAKESSKKKSIKLSDAEIDKTSMLEEDKKQSKSVKENAKKKLTKYTEAENDKASIPEENNCVNKTNNSQITVDKPSNNDADDIAKSRFEPAFYSTPNHIRDEKSNKKPEKNDSLKNVKSKTSVDDKKVKHLQEIYRMKKLELLKEQSTSKASVVDDSGWLHSSGRKMPEDANEDINRIDDLSIMRSPVPAVKSRSLVPRSTDKEDNIQKILTKGAAMNDGEPTKDPAHKSPTLLQTFRSLKVNRSLTLSEPSVTEG